MMQYLQAKSKDNKLEVRNNLPLAIDRIRLWNNGFIDLYVTDSFGVEKVIGYKDSKEIVDEWDIVNCYNDLKRYKEF